MQPRFLSVLPNPWIYIDERGIPNGTVLYDPTVIPPQQRRMIGAKIAKADLVVKPVVERVGHLTSTIRHQRHEITYQFSTRPVRIENTDYHRGEICRGTLIAADRETAQACGFGDSFEEPHAHLAKLRELAKAKYRRENPDVEQIHEPLTDIDTANRHDKSSGEVVPVKDLRVEGVGAASGDGSDSTDNAGA